jgi:hypothetical protein
MADIPTIAGPSDELHPHLLYRVEAGIAEFSTWRLEGGQEALALFTTAEAAEKYRAELVPASAYALLQPPREKLVTIFESCLAAGIRIAVLDPLGGGGRTLFDIAQVLQAAKNQAKN